MNIWKHCETLTQNGTSFVMVTMTGVIGSAPQEVGAKMLVTCDGLYAGTVGGGKVEMAAIRKSQEILSGDQSPPLTVKWNLQKDIGMTCGGEVIFLFEHFHEAPWPIVIFGAGHIAQALTRTLSNLSTHVTCIDSREEWISKLESVKKIHHPDPKELVKTLNPKSYFMCMTMGHSFDVPILVEIFKHAPDCPYVGVVGSDVKGLRIKNDLKNLGVSEEFINKLRVPMGLPIGNNQPYEISISIAAELLQVRDSLT
jgi:xanthine dehydrogenase accessory factor